jgi:hypothetical protein
MAVERLLWQGVSGSRALFARSVRVECQAGCDLFADHSLRLRSGGLAASCQLHGAKPNTEEASNPNEQASAQILSHEFRAHDLFRIITSHKEQDIMLATAAVGSHANGLCTDFPAMERLRDD